MRAFMPMFDGRLSRLFWERVVPEPNSGCWLWNGSMTTDGYAKYGDSRAHRLAFIACRPVPAGLVLDHLCRTRICVNPAHLEAVTHQENQRRGLLGYMKPTCPYGHAFNDQNTYYYTGGRGTHRGVSRNCRACNRARKAGRPLALERAP